MAGTGWALPAGFAGGEAVGAACVSSFACDSPGAAGENDIWSTLSFLAVDKIT